jgi:hypothetical protein
MPLGREGLFMSVFEMAAGDSANELARRDYKLDQARLLAAGKFTFNNA